jgi:putative FmdB family regulatory protein
MPIYEYRCSSCGHQQEFLQKVSDAVLTVCTACGQPTFSKMLTAAGFQLKDSGWYATDFKTKPSTPAAKADGESPAAKGDGEKPAAAAESKADTSSSTGSGTACGSGGCAACS